jgi:hypothetical protein
LTRDRDFAGERETMMMITINHERYGERQTFATIDEAQQSIRDCGPEFASEHIYDSGGRIYNARGEYVGSGSRDASPAVRESAARQGIDLDAGTAMEAVR